MELKHRSGCTLWFTGLSGAGKSTLSVILEKELRARGQLVEVLDGDVVRTNLSKGLGFSKEDRDTNIRRIGWVCEVLTRNGVVAIAAAISPYRAIRDEIRGKVGRFVEVYVEAPISVLAERDVKGLYKKALAGRDQEFYGRQRSVRSAPESRSRLPLRWQRDAGRKRSENTAQAGRTRLYPDRANGLSTTLQHISQSFQFIQKPLLSRGFLLFKNRRAAALSNTLKRPRQAVRFDHGIGLKQILHSGLGSSWSSCTLSQ